MSKGAFTALPIVDIRTLVSGQSDGAAAAAEQLGRAARDVGFCYVTGHGIPDATFDGLLAASQRFFALPMPEKMKVHVGSRECLWRHRPVWPGHRQ